MSIEATAVINRMSNLSAAEVAAITTFVDAEVANGNWTLYDEFYCFALNSIDALTGFFALTATAVNDPIHTILEGYVLNGSTQRINTNFNPIVEGVNYVQDDALYGALVHTATPDTGNNTLIGMAFGNPHSMIQDNSSTDLVFDINMNSWLSASGDGVESDTLYIVERTGASSVEIFRDGSSLWSSIGVPSTGLPDSDFWIGSRGANGQYLDCIVSTFIVGAAIGFNQSAHNINVRALLINLAPCVTNGGRAEETGLKTWCWGNVTIPAPPTNEFYDEGSGNQFKTDTEDPTDQRQIFNDGNQIKFDLLNTNKRAEISTQLWPVQHSEGTEEWFGWRYIFGNSYAIDQFEWLCWQVHHGQSGDSPQIEILIGKEGHYEGSAEGEILIKNGTIDKLYPIGIIPVADTVLDIVVHVVWGDENDGLLKIWMNDEVVYNFQERTIYAAYPWGGNAKWGIYKWPWDNQTNRDLSAAQGITHVETFIGALRQITRLDSDPNYLDDEYNIVRPRPLQISSTRRIFNL